MRCPKCGTQNPENKRFCGNCGHNLPLVYVFLPSTSKCPNCGADNPQEKRYCSDCGEMLNESAKQTSIVGPMNPDRSSSSSRGRVRAGYIVGGGLVAAIFFGVFFWANNYTYTERVWRDLGYGFGYWETVSRTIDPAIQALFLVGAMIGLIAAVYGAVSRR